MGAPRIRLVQATDPPQASVAQKRSVRPAEAPELATLHMTGAGQKQLALTVRYRLQRHGGWRTVRGQLPGCTVNALTLTVTESETEVRLSGVVDRTNFETTQRQERIETALTRDGAFQVEWRPKVGQATVDRSLTVQSEAILDVQEDGLRLVWTMQFKFPLSQRDRFTVQLPDAYVVEQVEGDNVRGWKAEDGRLEITLLKTARDAQSLVLHLARRGAVGAGELHVLEAPVVEVAEALLHEGRLDVRRSPLLELRVVDTEGLTRTDLNTATTENPSRVESPLGIRPFQAYRFTRTPFRLGLSVVPALGN